ncbi:MAG TPA: hypothetical protein VGA16_10670 [Candidatus Limnocylindria bacterium]
MTVSVAGRTLLVTFFAVYLIAGIWTTRRAHATGDETYYLMAADALVRGEGLDLTARWQDLRAASYDPGVPVPRAELERSTSPSRVRAGDYPLHDLGLPFLIAGPFALGGRALVVAGIALAMAAAVALGHRVAMALGVRPAHAMAGALAAGLSVPAMTYSGQVFADAIAPVPYGVALCALARAAPRWLFGPAVAALPLLHLRFWPLALALVVAYAVVLRPGRRELAATLVPLGIVVAVVSLVDLAVYGVPLPHAGFLLFFLDRPEARISAFTRPGGEGLLGVFVDRAFGLLPAAPIAAIAFVGAGCALRRRPSAVLAATAVPYLVLASFADWTGGFGPQARFLTVLVPLIVPLLGLALGFRWIGPSAVALGVWTLGQSLVYVVAPWLRYDSYGVPPLADDAWRRFVGIVPGSVFPLFGTDGATAALAAAYAALLAALAVGGRLVGCHAVVTRGPDDGSA